MASTVITYITIYVLCMFKIVFGPTMGYAAGLHPLESALLTIAGMMTTVVVFSFAGKEIRERYLKRYFKPKRIFTKRNRRFVKIWRKYGELGIAFLTPILLSPPGGTLISIALGGTPKKTISYMFIWSVFWSFLLTYGFYYFGDEIKQMMGKD